jgi:hypothetical protein
MPDSANGARVARFVVPGDVLGHAGDPDQLRSPIERRVLEQVGVVALEVLASLRDGSYHWCLPILVTRRVLP